MKQILWVLLCLIAMISITSQAQENTKAKLVAVTLNKCSTDPCNDFPDLKSFFQFNGGSISILNKKIEIKHPDIQTQRYVITTTLKEDEKGGFYLGYDSEGKECIITLYTNRVFNESGDKYAFIKIAYGRFEMYMLDTDEQRPFSKH